ncbi:MAG: hypothetical protein U0271_44900 [Polyangiaceae bacterium]
MNTSSLTLAILVAGGAAACSPWHYSEPNAPSGPSPTGQSYKDAVVLTCDVDHLAEVDPMEPDELADVKRLAFLEQHVDNGDGIYLRTMLSVRFGDARACLLRDAQASVGLDRCALAEHAEKAAPSEESTGQ